MEDTALRRLLEDQRKENVHGIGMGPESRGFAYKVKE